MLIPGTAGALSSSNGYSSHWVSTAPAVQYRAQFQAVSLLGQPAQSLRFQVLRAEPSTQVLGLPHGPACL